jgi:hypothetical protein
MLLMILFVVLMVISLGEGLGPPHPYWKLSFWLAVVCLGIKDFNLHF